ncbi:deoxyguanosinetriphosphate triphosphohydrolase [Coraliomargarita sinensis]|uniref:Deoxyguanosinetriphosphate triphosphohydrolase n=1 Tax=Coraliomargarita sinensis TaxID=2174842 RepID=A0A317ZPK5_9BACT|nr:dNTP triphosphohydrolase [Coraliomargarita sinensis]PXA05311.1 deoxyguanosinetriphosphate triphosphohydrolase [Coraliomargarita sinensis]
MQNRFYQIFDLERFPENQKIDDGEYRSAFEIERDRIVFSYPFRRLQSKTQVFQSGEYDFYRTRLTHSIEVAKIGRSICKYLRASSDLLSEDFYIDADLTEAVCLAHDLGHPPFGHIGERKLNELMAAHGGFEGNGQTLRILTELIYERPGRTKGIAPTRAFLDGVMKYKALHSEHLQTSGVPPENHFIYDNQSEWRQTIFGGDQPPAEMQSPASLNAFKSIECQIMDWADDTAYSLHDIVDGIHARYITVGSLNDWAEGRDLNEEQRQHIDKLCQVIRENRYEPYFGSRIGRFVHGCSLVRREGFLSDRTHRHAFDLKIDPSVKAESQLYKQIALHLIFKSTQLQQIEFKGGHILERLFQGLSEHCAEGKGEGLRILSPQVLELMDQESTTTGRYRRLCDYVAGLTDGLAVRTYKRLYDADFGSIAELV